MAEAPEETIAMPESAASHEALFWRRAARWGSTRGPDWFVRYAPPVIGWAAAACVPAARRAIRRNLHALRGAGTAVQDAREILETFANYAACLSDALSNDTAERSRRPYALLLNQRFLYDAMDAGRGIVLVTAHTAGWDVVGPLFTKKYGLDLMLVTHAEANARAGRLQDEARIRAGVSIAHVGDPLASLPLLRHLRKGGVVALQVDRVLPGMRARSVPVFGRPGGIPEGPFRLAQLSGATVVPVFSERCGYRDYRVHACEPRRLDRHASDAEIDEAATHVANAMTTFLRAHPTQWFHFAA